MMYQTIGETVLEFSQNGYVRRVWTFNHTPYKSVEKLQQKLNAKHSLIGRGGWYLRRSSGLCDRSSDQWSISDIHHNFEKY